MSETETTSTETTSTPAPEATPVETFSRDYVQKLRDEAAAARVAKNEAVAAAEARVRGEYDSKLAERDTQYTELESQLGAAGLELAKLRTALELNVPSDKVLTFASILKGETEDEIKSSAQAAYELAGGFKTTQRPVDFTQGHGGNGDLPLNGDPIMAALKEKLGI
ncbi:scaffolding protein [Mycobacterium phage Kykar]|nr:scaffolding protein [Mycobacterium phage Kykar]